MQGVFVCLDASAANYEKISLGSILLVTLLAWAVATMAPELFRARAQPHPNIPPKIQLSMLCTRHISLICYIVLQMCP